MNPLFFLKNSGFESRHAVKEKGEMHASTKDYWMIRNHTVERKDFFLGDAEADGEARRFGGDDDGPALGALTTGSGTSSGW